MTIIRIKIWSSLKYQRVPSKTRQGKNKTKIHDTGNPESMHSEITVDFSMSLSESKVWGKHYEKSLVKLYSSGTDTVLFHVYSMDKHWGRNTIRWIEPGRTNTIGSAHQEPVQARGMPTAHRQLCWLCGWSGTMKYYMTSWHNNSQKTFLPHMCLQGVFNMSTAD